MPDKITAGVSTIANNLGNDVAGGAVQKQSVGRGRSQGNGTQCQHGQKLNVLHACSVWGGALRGRCTPGRAGRLDGEDGV